MDFGKTVTPERPDVNIGSVTLVFRKTIMRILLMPASHQPVAMNFCDDGR